MSFTRLLLIWLGILVIISSAIGSQRLIKFWRLAKYGIEGEAIVTKLSPEYHQNVCYEYRVNGMPYKGRALSKYPNPNFDQLLIGNKLIVFYNPNDPSLSSIGNPDALLKNELISISLAAILGASFTVIVIALKFPK